MIIIWDGVEEKGEMEELHAPYSTLRTPYNILTTLALCVSRVQQSPRSGSIVSSQESKLTYFLYMLYKKIDGHLYFPTVHIFSRKKEDK